MGREERGVATPDRDTLLGKVIRFCLEQKLVVLIGILAVVGWGVAAAPFDWKIGWLPRDPVPVDAIPNLGENQQIVFTDWPGRSPQDVEEQVTYPLTVTLLGVPGVRTIRSLSMFGFSTIFIIFEEDVEFYWSRSRILERLSSLPAGSLPEGVQPGLGPDATALGQVFLYTLEGRDPDGNPAGGWDLHEVRSAQDWYVRFGLLSAEGVSEVASMGGFVQEYQVDVDPDALRAHGVTLTQVLDAVRMSNLDVGARTTEINRVEYVIRGLGFVRSLSDLEEAVVRTGPREIPIRVRDVAVVGLGPAERRGVLDKGGAEAVGGVVVVREGYNPLEAIQHVKEKAAEIAPGLPAKAVVDWEKAARADVERFAREAGFEAFVPGAPDLAQEDWLRWLRANPRDTWPPWVTLSQLAIVPFYDRTGLIYETLGTLNDALYHEILVTMIVVIVMMLHLRVSLVVSAMLPLTVLAGFIAMKGFGVDANIVALAGIAIAIGTIVDMGIVVSENVVKHLEEAPPEEDRLEVVYRGAREVGSAVVTAIATTVVSFLPVFTMTGAEGKMFTPLAYTKTFVLLASVVVAVTVVPAAMHLLVARRADARRHHRALLLALGAAGLGVLGWGLSRGWTGVVLGGLALVGTSVWNLHAEEGADWARRFAPRKAAAAAAFTSFQKKATPWVASAVAVILVGWVLTAAWEPLGPERGMARNLAFVAVVIGGVLLLFRLFERAYGPILRWCLDHKLAFLSMPLLLLLTGACVWLGFDRVFRFVPAAAEAVGLGAQRVRVLPPWVWATHAFPGLGREFMPPLDEGSFLWMPTTMPHASIGEAAEVLSRQNEAIAAIPEVESVVGKAGRAESALDPAPVSMIETYIDYKPEYATDEAGRRLTFAYDEARGAFVRDATGQLVPDEDGRPHRQWRDHIRSPSDIWDEIVRVAQIPGTTTAPKLQPIETRQVMLQTGMRAAMGLKVRAPDLETLEQVAMELEGLLRRAPGIVPATVNADRVVGKPYLEIAVDRKAIARFGLNVMDVQEVISSAIGGMMLTTTVEGRERYPVRVRYQRELRSEVEELEKVLVAGMGGVQIPLGQLAEIRYVRGPQEIKSEDTFLTAYVTFGGQPGIAEVDVVEAVQAHLRRALEAGELVIPPGVSYAFAGSYEAQLRAARTLSIVIPVALGIIFLILYFQFGSVPTTLIVFSGIGVAWAGGFVLLWLYGQEWFGNFHFFGAHVRELFQFRPVNLSVAVWVGFLALFGIAVDDGVVIATYLKQSFEKLRTETVAQIREATVVAGLRRCRPCLMTVGTTILALIPVLTSTGRGADLMIPMAIPSVGGMMFVLITMFTVPVLYCWVQESALRLRLRSGGGEVQT
ncbi:MAG: efflux RND transporter permease subunit [Thermodesulfobacteriota bacterium]